MRKKRVKHPFFNRNPKNVVKSYFYGKTFKKLHSDVYKYALLKKNIIFIKNESVCT